MRRAADKVDIAAAQGMFLPYGASGRCRAGPGKVRHLFRLHALLLGAAAEWRVPAGARSYAPANRPGAAAHPPLTPSAGRISVTLGSPAVIVPVLSSATIWMRPGFLQGCGGLEQNAVLRAQAVAHHDGYRRCQTQRAWAADHQHRNAARQRIANAHAQQQPHKGSHCCNGDHRWAQIRPTPYRQSWQWAPWWPPRR